MVQLRRELEGIRRDRAVPTPGYAADADASAIVLPALDREGLALAGDRLLFAGEARIDLALQLAEAGHWVSVTDLSAERLVDVHAQASPQASGRLTLVDKPYGDAAFGPSSFDTIFFYDAAHGFDRPGWVMRKIERELKFDGHLVARLLVAGALEPSTTADQPLPDAPAWWMPPGSMVRTGLDQLESSCTSRLAPLLIDASGRDAIDRGAHMQAARFAGRIADLDEAFDRQLTAERWLVGHSLRLRICDLLYGARSNFRRGLRRALEGVPELADAEDRRRDDPRVVGLIARKALGGKGAVAWGR